MMSLMKNLELDEELESLMKQLELDEELELMKN